MGLFDKPKNGMGKIIRKTLIPVLIKFILPPLIIFSLACVWYGIGYDTVNMVSYIVRTNGTNKNILKEGRSYKIDESIAKNVNEKLKNKAINPKKMELSDELIKKFYEAEIITSFPDLREKSKIGTPVTEGEIQGCIQFKRDSQIIEYMPFEDFQKVLAKFGYSLEDSNGNAPTINNREVYKLKEQVESKYEEELKGYFTLDEENNLIIAKMSSQEVITRYNAYAQAEMPRDEEDEDSAPVGYERQYTYNVDIKKINYQTELQKYSMPIEFLTSLLMVSQNSGFCEAVANLTKNSKIVVEIQDNTSTTETEEKYDYISHFYARKQYEYQYEEEVASNENRRTQVATNRKLVVRDDIPNYTPEMDLVPNPNNEEQNDGDEGEQENEQQQNQNPSENENKPTSEPKKEIKTITKNATGVYIKGRNMDNPYRTVVTTTKRNTVNLCVIEAKTWLIEAKAEYNKTQEETTTTNTIGLDYKEKDEDGWTIPAPEDIDLEEYKDVNDCHDLLDKLTHSNLPNGAKKVAGSSNNIEEVKEKKDETEETTIINIKTEEVKYKKVSSEVINKEENFLSLLKVDPNTNVFNKEDPSENTKLIKYKNQDGRTFSPEDNILSATQVLFSYIASSEHSQSYEETMRYLLYLYTGKSYGVTSFDFRLYEPGEFKSIGGYITGVFDCTISREDFIVAVENYNGSQNYRTYMVPYAGDFYDVCSANNINPIFAFAHSCLETGWGSNSGCQNDKNYFGYAHYNGNSSGAKYNAVSESIQDYCNWIKLNATGKASMSNNTRAQELAPYAPELNGTADTNIYVLFCRYAQLDNTHDASNNIGNPRIFMKQVFNEECSHTENSPTTTEEKAKYAVYTTNLRIKIANDIFGEYAIIGTGASGGLEVAGQTSQGYTHVYTSNLNSRTFKVYRQYLYPTVQYGKNGTIASQGCNIAAVATVLSGYGINKNPGQLVNGGTTQLRNVAALVRENGISCTSEIKNDIRNQMLTALKSGKTVIIHVDRTSVYAHTQHYMPILGMSEDSTQVYVGNPSRSYNGVAYDDIDHLLLGCDFIYVIG